MAATSRTSLVIGPDGLQQQVQAGDALLLPVYLVVALPSGSGIKIGSLAFASNGRALNTTASLAGLAFEAAGAGTGVLVSFNGTAWKVVGTNSTVLA